jgi:TolB-like protein
MVHDVFISYSHKDKSASDAICLTLEKNGISCWIAPRDINPGVPFAEAIVDGIKDSKVFVLVYSSNTNQSQQVIREVDRAVHHGLDIIPFRLEDVPMSKPLEYYVGNVHWLDALTPPMDKHITTLCQVVQRLLTIDKVDSDDIKDALSAETIKQASLKTAREDGRKKVTKLHFKSLKRKWLFVTTFAVLLLIAAVLFFPKIFKRDKFEAIRDASGKISIAVMPFENQTGDSTLNWYQRGIPSLITNGLGVSSELVVRDDQTIFEVVESMQENFTSGNSLLQAKKVAEKVRAETYISGSFHGTGGNYRILINLVDTKTGDIIFTNKVDGDLKSSGYFYLTDSLCNEIKDFLEIKVLEQKADYDFREAYPKSAEAYKYFIDGVNLILSSDYELAIRSLKKALEIDSTFTFAQFYIAFAYNFSFLDSSNILSQKWTQKAYKTKDRLPPRYQNWLEMWYACYFSLNQQDIIRYCNLLEKSGIESRLLWFDIGTTYCYFSEMYDRAVEAFEKVEEISKERGGDWDYDTFYQMYCEALLLADKPDEVQRISENGLKINPRNIWLRIYKGSSYVMLGDTLDTEKSISDIRTIIKNNNQPESIEEYYIGRMYLGAQDTIMVEKHWRKAYNLDPENPKMISNMALLLIKSEINIKEGLELAQKGLKLNPNDPMLLWAKGLALHKSGKHEEALEILKDADQKYAGYIKYLKIDIFELEKAIANQKKN